MCMNCMPKDMSAVSIETSSSHKCHSVCECRVWTHSFPHGARPCSAHVSVCALRRRRCCAHTPLACCERSAVSVHGARPCQRRRRRGACLFDAGESARGRPLGGGGHCGRGDGGACSNCDSDASSACSACCDPSSDCGNKRGAVGDDRVHDSPRCVPSSECTCVSWCVSE
jgi:hypothetical protein